MGDSMILFLWNWDKRVYVRYGWVSDVVFAAKALHHNYRNWERTITTHNQGDYIDFIDHATGMYAGYCTKVMARSW